MDNLLDKEAVKRVQKSLSSFDTSLKAQVLEQSARTAKDAATALRCEVGAIVKSLLLICQIHYQHPDMFQKWFLKIAYYLF